MSFKRKKQGSQYNPKGYAPLEDRPETHLKVCTKRSDGGPPVESMQRKGSGLSGKLEEEPVTYKGGFAKPMSLNPLAMAQVDQQTKALY